MKIKILVTIFLTLCAAPVLSMNNYDDPRKLLSYMDRALPPALDILRVTTKITPENQLIFQVKMRGESSDLAQNEYILLHITHGDHYALLIPANKNSPVSAILLKQAPHTALDQRMKLAKVFERQSQPATFQANHIHHGVNFSLPVDWIDFGNTLGYDAYTVQARLTDDTVHIEKIYDRAGKGRKIAKQFSAITFVNTLCATRRK